MTLTSSTVLVVDDERSVRQLLTQFLRRLGHDVVTADNGKEALVLLGTTAVDLILLDMMMPIMTGLELLKHVKADPALAEIPVVIVSSEVDVDNIATCLQLGAEDYLPKPFNVTIFGARVSRCLERRRLRIQERAYQTELERIVAERSAALRESEERYALAARGANDGLWDWDLRANRLVLSPRWMAMLGYAEDEIGTDPDEWMGLIHPDDRERLEVKLAAHFRQLITHFQHEYRIRHRDGTYRWVLCRGLAVWDESGQAVRVAGSQTDISDRKRAEQQLLHDALHDGLTGLPNRVLFLDRLKQALLRSQRNPAYRFAVLFLDLDRFKVINDSLGHAAGDQLLENIARRLEESLRTSDTLARLGGDEFTVLIEDVVGEEAVLALADRLQQAISAPVVLGQREVFTTASIGATMGKQGYTSAMDIIRDADTAMYHAKVGGKARVVLFNASMHAAAMELLQIESTLRWALERDELRLHYQPIVVLDTGQLVGFEALVRWQHPQRGLLLPGAFIAVAEETGLIVPIGWWVLHTACQQLCEWRESNSAAKALWVTVNMSARQLGQPDVVQRVLSTLAETGLPADCLKLEITETTLIERGLGFNAALQELRAAGVQICMDDFGTGYSSLSYLQRLPVDALKIDRSFVQQISAGGQVEIVQTIVALARALGLLAVAEGAETLQQVEQLRELHCEYGQGWYFAKAMEPAAAAAVISSDAPLLGLGA
jgi:diguanylate cyclase (GGDEF)-like protein/PAS domain S-box-containing protein